jgi:hypothetical protein
VGADVDGKVAGLEELAQAVDFALRHLARNIRRMLPMGVLHEAVGRQIEIVNAAAPVSEGDVLATMKQAAERHRRTC